MNHLYIYIGIAVGVVVVLLVAKTLFAKNPTVKTLTENYRFPLTYAQQVGEELQKCTWPWDANLEAFNPRKYRQLTESTVVVIVLTVMMAGLISISDVLIHPAVGFLTNSGSK